MKLSITVANTHALSSSFVVYRGFEESIPKIAKLGFDGIELALKRANEIDPVQLKKILDKNGLEVSCISTGQVYADGGLILTHDSKQSREEVKSIFKEFIDLAADFGKNVNIGRIRGQIGGRSIEYVEAVFTEVVKELCIYALPKGVTLILEPVNRYEIDFINTVDEGVKLIQKISMPNMMVLADVFHMNIEDKEIGSELARNIQHIKYIHFADSNRLAPGQGHTDFRNIFNYLLEAGYNGWISAEILPKPNPDIAADQAADFLLPLVSEYNNKYAQMKKVSNSKIP